jgi:Uma2 family endonuclease
MVTAKQQAASAYEALAALPEHVVGEVIGGELFVQPRPRSSHALASSHLGGSLFGPFTLGNGGPGGWVILDEPELHFGEPKDILVPDLAGWRRERMPEVPDAAAFTLAPDWVCEVMSPSTALHDRKKKLPIYARERVGHVWSIDPEAKSLEVLRLEGAFWQIIATYGDSDRVRAEPFDAVELDLAILWAR